MSVVERGTVIAGRYVVSDEIGRGGMGIVYRVEHVHTGESLALKVLIGAARSDPNSVARFKREARASARVRSDHVVRVTDADVAPELDGSPFIVMELLRGTDLEEHITKNGPLQPETLVPLLAQIGRALEMAHRLGIVHRDLKPENLFLHEREDGSTIAKVLDFGISKFVAADRALETAGMTVTGSVIGTPLYMAPEQAHGDHDKIAPTTDVWSLGLVTLRLLTGEHYWGTPTLAELMMKLVVKDIIPPSERWPDGPHMSPALDRWFLRSCVREQAERWPSVERQMAELAAVFGIALPSRTGEASLPAIERATDAGARATSTPDEARRLPPELREALASTASATGDPLVAATVTSTGEKAISPLSRSTVQQPARPERSRLVTLGGVGAIVLVGVVGLALQKNLSSSSSAPGGSTSQPAEISSAAERRNPEPEAPRASATASTPPPAEPTSDGSKPPARASSSAATASSTAPSASARPRAVASASARAAAAPASASAPLYAPVAP